MPISPANSTCCCAPIAPRALPIHASCRCAPASQTRCAASSSLHRTAPSPPTRSRSPASTYLSSRRTERTSRAAAPAAAVAWNLTTFRPRKTPESFAKEAVRQAILQLHAVPAPAGEMEVVLGPGWPGVLLHEAVGHGLEADFNRKGTSAFSGLIGQSVASSKVTVVDNGRMPNRRGSLNVDDEGIAHAGNGAHRKRHSQGLHERQTLVAAYGDSGDRQLPPRKLSGRPHAAHDEHLHACR